jgi:hypothetical protein
MVYSLFAEGTVPERIVEAYEKNREIEATIELVKAFDF